MVGGNISDSTFNTFPDFYPQGQTLDSVTEATVLAAKGAGAKSLGIIYCSEAPTCLQSAGEDKTAAGGVGVSVGYEAQASSSAPNYTAQCVAAQQAKAQGIILLYAPATAGTIAANCATQGYNPIYAMEGGAINFHFSESATGLKNDLVGPFTDLPSISSNPEIQQMNSALSKEYPGIEDKAAWTEEAPSAWAAALLLAAAAKDGGLTSGGTPSAADDHEGPGVDEGRDARRHRAAADLRRRQAALHRLLVHRRSEERHGADDQRREHELLFDGLEGVASWWRTASVVRNRT